MPAAPELAYQTPLSPDEPLTFVVGVLLAQVYVVCLFIYFEY